MAIGNKKKRNQLVDDEKHILSSKSPFAVQEAYKSLRTNIIFSTAEKGCQIVLVTSSEQGETKSTTAVNLALTFAQNKSRVLLIDCDLRLPTVAQKLQIGSKPGLTDLLVGRTKVEAAVKKLDSGLYVLPAGTLPPNPAELLGSENMGKLLDQLKSHFDQIILDTPPVNTLTDAVVLTPFVSGVVVVSRQGMTSMKDLRAAIRKLEFADAHIYGLILTGNRTEKHRSYKKGYGYRYGNKYGYGYARSYEKASGR